MPRAVTKLVINQRQRLGLTQDSLAKSVGVDRRTIVRLENGDQVSKGSLNKVASALQLPVKVITLDGKGLSEAQDDCITRIVGAQSEWHLRAVAIDLANGCEYIEHTLNVNKVRPFSIKVLLLDTPVRLPKEANSMVEYWATNADNSLDFLKRRFTPETWAAGGRFQLERYAAIPSVHGVALNVNGKNFYWLTECFEEDGATYFGDEDYMIFEKKEATPEATPERAARMVAFEKRFSTFWPQTDEHKFPLELPPRAKR